MKASERKLKKRKENVRYFKSIKAENNVLKGKLWDFRNRSQQGNLRFDGMVEYEDDYWTDTEENVKNSLCRLNIKTKNRVSTHNM